MKKISTVLGEISPDELGITLTHEHIVCASPAMVSAFGNKWMERERVVEKAVTLLTEARREFGVSSIVDATPVDLCRDISILREVSEKSGVNILCSTGIYHGDVPFLQGKKPERLSKTFIDECINGIADTGVRPAVLKCATDTQGVTEINEITLLTMAAVQSETGLPLIAHNNFYANTAEAQTKVLKHGGADMSRTVIAHASDCKDIPYLEGILSYGCYLGFDRIYPEAYEWQAAVIWELIKRGYADRLLLSHDYCAFIDFGDYDGVFQYKRAKRDYSTVSKLLLPELCRLGATEDKISLLTVENPKRFLSL